MNRIDFAQTFATAAHAGQVRPYTGEPYIGHPARVVGILQQYYPNARDELIIAAWLHDVVEDCQIGLDAILESFGEDVALLVDELTKPNEPITLGAKIIKACDMIDNVGQIAAVAPASAAQKYLEKKRLQAAKIGVALWPFYPDLSKALTEAWMRNWSAVA